MKNSRRACEYTIADVLTHRLANANVRANETEKSEKSATSKRSEASGRAKTWAFTENTINIDSVRNSTI